MWVDSYPWQQSRKERAKTMTIETMIIKYGDFSENNKFKDMFHKLRNTVFMEEMGWELNEIDGEEYDEYDCRGAEYVIAIDRITQEVVGGARLLPTTLEFYASSISIDPTTYMIADAHAGTLEGMPGNM